MSDDRHGEHLNVEAYFALHGLRPLIAETICALLLADVPIHPLMRKALAEALMKGKDEQGVRLEVRGTGSGEKDNYGYQVQVRQRWLIAGRHIEQLVADGMTIDDAKREVTSLSDHRGVFGYRPSQAAEAWKFLKRFREFQERNSHIFAGSDRQEWMHEGAFIHFEITGKPGWQGLSG